MEWRRREATVFVVVALFVASVVDPRWAGLAEVPTVGGVSWLHLVGYATLAAVIDRGRSHPAVPVALAVGYGFLLELVQFGVPYRTFSLLDAATNAAGACLGVGLIRLRGRLLARRAD
ncbi:MAG: VanZ family protein [Haloplanus sp.]